MTIDELADKARKEMPEGFELQLCIEKGDVFVRLKSRGEWEGFNPGAGGVEASVLEALECAKGGGRGCVTRRESRGPLV